MTKIRAFGADFESKILSSQICKFQDLTPPDGATPDGATPDGATPDGAPTAFMETYFVCSHGLQLLLNSHPRTATVIHLLEEGRGVSEREGLDMQ